MELKWEIGKEQNNTAHVLIVPLWNWNAEGNTQQGQFDMF